MGGVIAQDGFAYQLWDCVRRIPKWLANPAFEYMIIEGLEDYEARFFAPHAPHLHLLERYQAKRQDLSPGEVGVIMDSFYRWDVAHPGIARVQTLVTPRLPKSLQWLHSHADRVRRARPFYSPFRDVEEVISGTLEKKLTEEFGQGLGKFIATFSEVDEQNIPDRDTAFRAFSSSLESAFPEIEPSSRKVRAAFERLCEVAQRALGEPITREVLLQEIVKGLGEDLPLPTSFPILVRSDRDDIEASALEIDASPFCGGDIAYPPTDEWEGRLSNPLRETAAWLRRNRTSRIALDGFYRLTTAMIIGYHLRSAHGFELEIPTRSGNWATNEHLAAEAVIDAWEINRPEVSEAIELSVCIGILKDPSNALPRTAGTDVESTLALHLPKAIESGKEAQGAVALIIQEVNAAVAKLAPQKIRLFFVGPAALAVALGHRWNALPDTQLHEFINDEGRYAETAII